MLNSKEKIFLIKSFYLLHFNYKQLKINFKSEFNRQAPSNAVIKRIIDKFEVTGSIERATLVKKQSISVSLVEEYFTLQPQSSVRQAERHLKISRSQIQHILKHILKLKPYKTQSQQLLTVNAKIKRLYFANNFDVGILPNIWFSDESYFYLHPKSSNTVMWAKSKPNNNFIQTPSHSAKILVWMAVSHKGIFWREIQGNMTAQTYLNLLKLEFIPYLNARNIKHSTFFMQDGAPCHTAKTVLSYLNEEFKERVISTRYPATFNEGLEWPPYSPDLTPLDYCIWGVLKARIVKHKPLSLNDLRQALRTEVSLLDQLFIVKTVASIIPRIEALKKCLGGHIEMSI